MQNGYGSALSSGAMRMCSKRQACCEECLTLVGRHSHFNTPCSMLYLLQIIRLMQSCLMSLFGKNKLGHNGRKPHKSN